MHIMAGVFAVPADRGPQSDTDQERTAKAGDDLGDVVDRLDIHDHREDQDGIESAMLKIAVLGQSALLDQHDGHRADIHRADAQTDGDDEQVLA